MVKNGEGVKTLLKTFWSEKLRKWHFIYQIEFFLKKKNRKSLLEILPISNLTSMILNILI